MYMVAHFVAVSVSYRLKRRISGGWVDGWVRKRIRIPVAYLPSPQEYRAAGGRVKPTGYSGGI